MDGKDTTETTFFQLFGPVFNSFFRRRLKVLEVEKLRRPPQRASRGRPRVDHEKVFQFTLRQVIEGEADHLDDLSYDPLFL